MTFLPGSYVWRAVETGELTNLDLRDMPPLTSQPVLIAHKERELDHMHLEFIRIFKMQ